MKQELKEGRYDYTIAQLKILNFGNTSVMVLYFSLDFYLGTLLDVCLGTTLCFLPTSPFGFTPAFPLNVKNYFFRQCLFSLLLHSPKVNYHYILLSL